MGFIVIIGNIKIGPTLKSVKLTISPFWRAWFWIFFCVCAIEGDEKRPLLSSAGDTLFSPLFLAIVAIFSELISQSINRLPYHAETIVIEMVALMIVGAHLAFIPVQRYVNSCENGSIGQNDEECVVEGASCFVIFGRFLFLLFGS